MKNNTPLESRIDKLKEKYQDSGQDLGAHLDGLFHQRYLTYWDYIHLDTLLSLQMPRTQFPDEWRHFLENVFAASFSKNNIFSNFVL